jgi:deferrochelatase/peroxidase EfeB
VTKSQSTTPTEKARLSRRGLFGLAGAGVVGAGVVGAGVALGIDRAVVSDGAADTSGAASSYPFYGAHQSGITTAAQDRVHFASFDVSDISRSDLIGLLKDWTAAAARMTEGKTVGDGAVSGPLAAPQDDTGEALGLPPAGLTVTFGFGPSLFDHRFGLATKRPAALIDLPHFAGDMLVPSLVGGDLCVQACSDDPQVAVHAIRNLSRIAFGRASIRWSQLGFGRTSSTTRAQATPRNLFGFKDGTANVKAEDRTVVDEHIWVPTEDSPGWMSGGSYLVSRKIRMNIEPWDRSALGEQQRVIGRTKGDGAPLSGGSEFTEPDFAKKHDSALAIDADAHVRLAHPTHNHGAVLLRRGYNFVDGSDDLGQLNAGLFFIAFQRDPRKQFVPIQLRLAGNDALNEYLQHVGSGIFAVPPGARRGSYVGAGLFET